MMSRAIAVTLILILGACLFACAVLGWQVARMQRVISDQREYIEAGCAGRYEGQE